MGGKHKQAQRTKNNARPSSSGRSAEFLGATTPFQGFSTGKEIGFSLPSFSLAPNEDFDSSIDTNFQLVLKKMNKKDSTTKLKALQEFGELVKCSDSEAVKAVLPFWPRLYNILATDTEHRVREGAHVAHNEVVLKAKRNIAPHLKQLIAPWFTSQYDTYAPASSAASLAFKNAFPEGKTEEAIIFCQNEILTYICDNLTVQTAQTLSNPKTSTPEEMDSKYERIIISSLQGYALYLNKVPSSQIEKALELNAKIVTNAKFWKYSKHKLAPIRAAWYGVLTELCQKGPFLLNGQAAHVTGAVFTNLDESEPTVLPYVWQCALLSMTSIKNWHSFVNIEKVLLPKLWKVLKEGGQGNSTVIYPNLLPLVSNILTVIDENTFYNNFFEHLRTGLKQKTVLASKSESVAVSTAFTECLQYIILKNQTNIPLCQNLIKLHLIPTIEWCILDNNSCFKTIFNLTSAVVQNWSRNQDKNPNYEVYLNYFWVNITSLFQGVLLNLQQNYDSTIISEISGRQIEFLHSLKRTVKPKKHLKVSFERENSESSSNDPAKENAVQNSEKYANSLTELVYKICEAYVDFISEKKSKELLEHLLSLIQDFDCTKFFTQFSKHLGKSDNNQGFLLIYDYFFKNWLFSDNLRSKPLINLIFLLYKYLDDDGKKNILSTFEQISSIETLGWIVSEAIAHPYCNDEQIKIWLKSSKVTRLMVDIVEKEINDESTPDLTGLLKVAVTENSEEEIMISNEAISQIIQKLTIPLLEPKKYEFTLDSIASFSAYLAAIIYTENLLLTFTDKLLLSLFKLSCQMDLDEDILSTDTLWEVQTSWQDAICILSKELPDEKFEQLFQKIIAIVEHTFLENEISDKNIEIISLLIVNVVRSIYKSKPLQNFETLDKVFKRTFVKKYAGVIFDTCLLAEYNNGKISAPYVELGIQNETLPMDSALKYFVWNYVKLEVLSHNLEDSYEEDEDHIKIISTLDTSEIFIMKILNDLELCGSFCDNFNTTQFNSTLLNYYNLTIIKLKDTHKVLSEVTKNKIKTMLQQNLNSTTQSNFFTSKIIQTYYTKINTDKNMSPVLIYEDFARVVSKENMLSLVQLTQTFGRFLSFDNVLFKFDNVGSVIVLRSLIHCSDIEVQIAEVFRKIEEIRSENVPRFLFESSNIDWIKAQEILEIIRLCSELIKTQSENLMRRHWDFGIISLAQWAGNILKSKTHYEKVHVQATIIAIFEYFTNVNNQINKIREVNPKNQFVSEWDDLFLPSLHNEMLQLWLYLTEQFEHKQKYLPVTYLPLIYKLNNVVSHFQHIYIFKNTDSNLPKWSKLVKRCCGLLLSPVTSLQLCGYNMLLTLVPGLIEIDSVSVNTNTPHEKGLIFEQFKDILVNTHEVVNAMLLEFKLGEDSCTVQPYTDSFTYTFAYLLVWDVLLTLCEKSSTELRFQYADWLRNENLLQCLFNNLFRLMPTEILHYNEGNKTYPVWFSSKPSLNLSEGCTTKTLEHMVCWVYALTLSQLPALVRQWWSGAETRTSQIVEKITSVYVSPQLCTQELADVSQHECKFKNMTIKVIPSVREVLAIYTVDEAQMELVITLPTNYPLAGPEIHCNRQIGGTSHKQWLMQLKKCVLHQNGRIWDGLSLWNNNLDKKFDGVEECYICFAVLHPGTYQLPKLSCQTCKKKFHSACLYKWFSTSNKSSCPICRNLF